MIRRRSNWFAAVVFFVVQLCYIVPSCYANQRTPQLQYHVSTHNGAANLRQRRRNKEYRRVDNTNEGQQELSGHDTTTYDNNNNLVIPVHVDAGSTRDNSVSEEQSTIKISTTGTKQLDQQQSAHRQTRDVEDILNEMAHKDPQEWTAVDLIVLIMFLTMFCWIYSCLCALCCCGRRGGGGGSSLLNWLCFYEICCRDGRDLDVCCDYATSTLV